MFIMPFVICTPPAKAKSRGIFCTPRGNIFPGNFYRGLINISRENCVPARAGSRAKILVVSDRGRPGAIRFDRGPRGLFFRSLRRRYANGFVRGDVCSNYGPRVIDYSAFSLDFSGYNVEDERRRQVRGGAHNARRHDPPTGHSARWGRNPRDQRYIGGQSVRGSASETFGQYNI